ncbi:MAG: alpha/beta hydrolase, partial [Planctomycetota bacterium]
MTARLHCISRYYGAGKPSRWVVFLHGILGSGSNWAGFATDLARRKPDWGVLAVDLRHHGRSGRGTPPDGVSACVDDLQELFAKEKIQIGAVVGHSFGSKIGLELCVRIPGVKFCAVIDADPG